MDHGIKPFQVRMFDVAEVFSNGGEVPRGLAKCALLEKITVQSDHMVARIGDHGRHDRANVAFMPCN